MNTGAVDPLTLGLTLAILGMGGTLVVLYVLGLLASLLKRLFPIKVEKPAAADSPAAAPKPPAAQPPATA